MSSGSGGSSRPPTAPAAVALASPPLSPAIGASAASLAPSSASSGSGSGSASGRLMGRPSVSGSSAAGIIAAAPAASSFVVLPLRPWNSVDTKPASAAGGPSRTTSPVPAASPSPATMDPLAFEDDPAHVAVDVKHVPIAGSVVLFAVLGAVIRIVVSGGPSAVLAPRTHAIGATTDPRDLGAHAVTWAALASLYVPQLVGCAVMGWVVQGKAYLSRIYMPLYVGLTTGLCGAITSFSTVAAVSVAPLVVHDGWKSGYPFLFSLILLTTALSSSYAAFRVGTNLGALIRGTGFPVADPDLGAAPVTYLPARFRGPLSARDGFTVAVGAALWTLAIVGAIVTHAAWGPTDGYVQLLLSLALAPAGALMRYALGAGVRAPWGTLAANLLAVAVYGGVALGTRERGKEAAGYAVAVQLGFCGCLSTVSTLVNEFNGLAPRKGAGYLLVTCVPAIVYLVLTMGLPVYLAAEPESSSSS
ncbi:hypothetical protein H9P43_010013 [Blastocladiella emersonii ATCC 22665]|nr:hypothetical protein H9P43_010013 [Blastocladiella emersonii ATCC 22665]